MKKIVLLVSFSVLLMVGCAIQNSDELKNNQGSEPDPITSSFTDIEHTMNLNSYPPETIIHYELKGSYIYVFTRSTQGLAVSILKETNEELIWLDHYNITESMSILDAEEKEMPVLTVVTAKDDRIKDVKVLGEYAKMVRLVTTEVEDYIRHTTFWIHFNEWDESYTTFEQLPVHSIEKIMH